MNHATKIVAVLGFTVFGFVTMSGQVRKETSLLGESGKDWFFTRAADRGSATRSNIAADSSDPSGNTVYSALQGTKQQPNVMASPSNLGRPTISMLNNKNPDLTFGKGQAAKNEVAIEVFEIAHKGFERKRPLRRSRN